MHSSWKRIFLLGAALGITACTSPPPLEPSADQPSISQDAFARELGVNDRGYRVFERHQDGARMVLVPAGHFQKREDLFLPPKNSAGTWRETKAFLCDEHEVTNLQVLKFIESQVDLVIRDETVFASDGRTALATNHPWGLRVSDGTVSLQSQLTARHPAVGTSGHLALAYARWVGGDLPTGDEFEKAAGGPSGLLFPWGGIDQMPDSTFCNSYLHGPQHPVAVASYPKGRSPYGLHDMAGNVYERAYWNADAATGGRPRSPTMIKGGGWTTSHWWNHRCVDRCGQPMDAMEGAVGFRVVVRDPTRLSRLGATTPTLRIFTDTEDALTEASHRNVPILLYLGYETCGQCDRVQGELFRDPRFVTFANEHAIVLVGHHIREDNEVPKLPTDEQGRFFAHTRADRDTMRFVFDDFRTDSLTDFLPVPREIEYFTISPGLFVINPHVDLMSGPEDTILIPEDAFGGHKTGGSSKHFIQLITEAQGYLGQGMGTKEFAQGMPPLISSWRPGQRRPKSRDAVGLTTK